MKIKMNKLGAWALGTTMFTASVLPFSAAHAQVDTIVVTAQKREQNVNDVGIAVTAISGEKVRDLGLQNSVDIEAQTPGVLIGEFGGSPAITTVNIRGVAQLDFTDHQESPNAVYVDGAYVSFLGGLNVSLFDLERVEVLRGPQGTLFGRNATGGLIHLISAKPTDEFEAYADITIAEFDKVHTEGAISGPLTDNLRGRLSFSTRHQDGFYRNTGAGGTTGDIGQDKTINFRGQLDADLGDRANVLLSGRYSTTDNARSGVYHQVGAAPDPANDGLVARITDANRSLLDDFCTGFNGVPTVTPPGGSDCFGSVESADVFSVSPDTLGTFDRELFGFTGTITYDLSDSITLTSITDYQSIERFYLEDNDSTILPVTTFEQSADGNQFSQELRLNGSTDNFEWVFGGYFLNIDLDAVQRVNQSPFFDIDFSLDYTHETTSWAIFGQGEYAFNDQLSLIGGLRWTHDEKEIDQVNDCLDTDAFGFGGTCAAFGLAVGERVVGGRSDGDWAGKAQLNYRPNGDWLLYAGVTRGNKGGILNATVGAGAGVSLAGLQVEPEVLTSYEAGFKATLADGLAQLNATGYYYDYSNYQAFEFIGVAVSLFNAEAQVFGSEVELQLAPTDGLDLSFGLAYTDGTVEDVVLPSGRVADQELPYAPDISFNGLARYEWPLLGGLAFVQGDFNYVGSRFFSTVNHPVVSDESYIQANARIGFTSQSGRWGAELFVNNLTDNERLLYSAELSIGGGGYGIESYAAPRVFGGRIRLNYN